MNKTNIKVKGFFRVQITEDDNGKTKVVGNSGWKKNQITNLGIQDYLVDALIGDGGAKAVTHMALGAGSAPASNATSLQSEITHASNSRKAVSTSIVASRTAQFTAAFASSASFITAAVNISNIGLFETSTTEGGTLFAGNTYASSSLASNQNVKHLRLLIERLVEKLSKLRETLYETIRSQVQKWKGSETIMGASFGMMG